MQPVYVIHEDEHAPPYETQIWEFADEGSAKAAYWQLDASMKGQRVSSYRFWNDEQWFVGVAADLGEVIPVSVLRAAGGKPVMLGLDTHHWLADRRAKLRAASSPPIVRYHDGKRVGRNDPCPCGSGAKTKRCCGV